LVLDKTVASDEGLHSVILDTSVLFTEEVLDWLSDPELSRALVVSDALWQRLEDPEAAERFAPYAHPTPDQITKVREALVGNEITRFSYRDVTELPPGASQICDVLLSSDEPLGDVLADEWAFLTSQSIAVIAEQTRDALDAFRRAGAEVLEVSRSQMEQGLKAVRSRIPKPLLKVMKFIGRFPWRTPKWLVVGGGLATAFVPHIGVPVAIANAIKEGVAVIAGDP
jgi:hypothetical protein